jgi:hypothetical protein
MGAVGAGATVIVMPQRAPNRKAQQARREFLRHFPDGFRDETYIAWERDYKLRAHEAWVDALGPDKLAERLDNDDHASIAHDAVRIESRTNLLFSFEKMALRDALKNPAGAKLFAAGLYDFLHGGRDFERWVDVVSKLPRRQTRVLTWPVATVFGMIAQPKQHIFVKPWVTQIAAEQYGFDLLYRSRPNEHTYERVLAFAEQIRRDHRDLKPRDMIDLQSFIWVLGSDEY